MRAADTISIRAGWDQQFFHRATRGMCRCTGASLFLLILLLRAERIIRTSWSVSQDENDNRFHLESQSDAHRCEDFALACRLHQNFNRFWSRPRTNQKTGNMESRASH